MLKSGAEGTIEIDFIDVIFKPFAGIHCDSTSAAVEDLFVVSTAESPCTHQQFGIDRPKTTTSVEQYCPEPGPLSATTKLNMLIDRLVKFL